MKTETIKKLFQQAEAELLNAEKELLQPSGDVVEYSVCINARSSLYRFLSCLFMIYSDDQDVPGENNYTMEQLIKFCKKYNDELQGIDFSSVHCKCLEVLIENEDEIFYCNNVYKVKYCTVLANQVKTVVLNHTGIDSELRD